MERETAASAGIDLGDAVGPWWNPPIYAWVFAPLTALPFSRALVVWSGINLAAAGVAIHLLGGIVQAEGGADRALTALLILASAPLLQSIAHGQNSAISLLLVSIVVTAWRGGNTFLASACVGLLGYKPQLAAALAVALVLHRGFRAGAGLAYVATVLLALGAQTMPGAFTDYVHRLPLNLHAIQVERAYGWDRHVTLGAFWRLLIQGQGPGETSWIVHALTVVSAAPLAAGLLIAAVRARWRAASRDTLIATTIVTAPLLMPFYFDYDLLLLAAAAALARRPLALWAPLYLWLFVNPYVAGAIRVNFTVPLLWALAASLIASALRKHEQLARSDDWSYFPVPLAKAA